MKKFILVGVFIFMFGIIVLYFLCIYFYYVLFIGIIIFEFFIDEG